jgi:hypothetical protein
MICGGGFWGWGMWDLTIAQGWHTRYNVKAELESDIVPDN